MQPVTNEEMRNMSINLNLNLSPLMMICHVAVAQWLRASNISRQLC